jgi:transaldolase
MRLTSTKLFIDGGDPRETAQASGLLTAAGYDPLDGQTTNPSLVAKNPEIAARVAAGQKLTEDELLERYRDIVRSIERSAPGDISIEVYADQYTSADMMVAQARDMASWISSAVIKLPITLEGLKAATILKGEMRLNLTLCFSQEQAAAVYGATLGAAYPVYVSPFIGRLDDRGENGMDLVANILKMYAEGDGHVHVLTASVRNVSHVLGALQLGSEAITMPFTVAFKPWAEQGFLLPPSDFVYPSAGSSIPYEAIGLTAPWHTFSLAHELTDLGLQRFADDWRSLLIIEE